MKRREHRSYRRLSARDRKRISRWLARKKKVRWIARKLKRTIPGRWEGDLLIGWNQQPAPGLLVERTTRTTLLVRLKRRDALSVGRAFARKTKRLPAEMRLSMNYDQGREMAQYRLLTKETQMQVYFAHPARPWERGTSENTNGLIRDFSRKIRTSIKCRFGK